MKFIIFIMLLMVSSCFGAAPILRNTITTNPIPLGLTTQVLIGGGAGGATPTWAVPSATSLSIITKRQGDSLFDDLTYALLSGSQPNGQGTLGLYEVVSGTGAAVAAGTSESTAPGVQNITLGTTTTGYGGVVAAGAGQILFGAGIYTNEWRIRINQLPTVAESYIGRIGFSDGITGTIPVDGCYFTWSTNDTHFICVTRQASTQTTITNATTVTAAIWYKLRVVVTNATSAVFTVDDADIQTLTANIPNGAGRATGISGVIVKDAGTTAASIDVDYIALDYRLNATR